MDKAGKAVALEAYKKVFADAGVIVVTQYSGLTVRELTDLRVKLKSEGAALKVIKNRLAKIAWQGILILRRMCTLPTLYSVCRQEKMASRFESPMIRRSSITAHLYLRSFA